MSTPLNPLAVVTGASGGIGLELAHQLAENGFDLIVSAEDDELALAADALRASNVAVEAVRGDLSRPERVEQLVGRVTMTGRPVEALVVNTGGPAPGPFVAESTLDEQLTAVDLNVRSAVHLTKRLVPTMTARGSGRVLFTSSIAAGPFRTVGNAATAFLRAFAESLREELWDSGVTVTAVMPETDDPEAVAKQGYDAMMADEKVADS